MFDDSQLLSNTESFRTIRQEIESDPSLYAILQETTNSLVASQPPRDPNIVCFNAVETASAVVVGFMSLPITYALLRFAKIYFDDWQGNKELDLARKQTEFILDLTQKGFSPEESTALAFALLHGIRVRADQDIVLERVFSLHSRFLELCQSEQTSSQETETSPQLPPSA